MVAMKRRLVSAALFGCAVLAFLLWDIYLSVGVFVYESGFFLSKIWEILWVFSVYGCVDVGLEWW